MIHCANLIINYSVFLFKGGNICFLANIREIMNCGNNFNRKNKLKILANISKPTYLQLDKVIPDTSAKVREQPAFPLYSAGFW